MSVEIVSVAVALLSVIVAVWLGRKNQRLGREKADLQKRLLKIEEERRADEKVARLAVQFHYDGKRRVLRISNTGNGQARNIRLRIDGVDATEHPCWVEQQYPISFISGENHADILLSMTMRDPIPKEAEVLWDDDMSQGKSSRSTLTL